MYKEINIYTFILYGPFYKIISMSDITAVDFSIYSVIIKISGNAKHFIKLLNNSKHINLILKNIYKKKFDLVLVSSKIGDLFFVKLVLFKSPFFWYEKYNVTKSHKNKRTQYEEIPTNYEQISTEYEQTSPFSFNDYMIPIRTHNKRTQFPSPIHVSKIKKRK